MKIVIDRNFHLRNSQCHCATLTRAWVILALHSFSRWSQRRTIFTAKLWWRIGALTWPQGFTTSTCHCTLCPVTPGGVTSINYNIKDRGCDDQKNLLCQSQRVILLYNYRAILLYNYRYNYRGCYNLHTSIKMFSHLWSICNSASQVLLLSSETAPRQRSACVLPCDWLFLLLIIKWKQQQLRDTIHISEESRSDVRHVSREGNNWVHKGISLFLPQNLQLLFSYQDTAAGYKPGWWFLVRPVSSLFHHTGAWDLCSFLSSLSLHLHKLHYKLSMQTTRYIHHLLQQCIRWKIELAMMGNAAVI